LVNSDLDVRVTQAGGVYRISFVGEMSDKTTAEKTLTVDGSGLLPSPGASATVDFAEEREIALAPGFADGNLLEWDGTNWVAMPRMPIAVPTKSIMQPFQVVNFIIALQGIFPSQNGIEPFIAEIVMFGGNFAPQGWALCDGQLLSIAQNTALFSILGTTYGGDGQTTFGLPDLRGRVPIHDGNGPGLSPRRLGEKAGQETIPAFTIN